MIELSTTAMVLAAGLGKRMGALTLSVPKPLLPIGDTNCLEISVNALTKAGFKKIIVNTHYLPERIEAFVSRLKGVEIAISHEPRLLETAGGIRKALDAFEGKNFVVANADAYWRDGNPSIIDELRKSARETDSFCLGVVPLEKALAHPGKGDFTRDDDGSLRRPAPGADAPKFAYMGVQIINPKAIEFLEPNASMSLTPLYFRAAALGKLRGVVFDGLWVDAGTPSGYALARKLHG